MKATGRRRRPSGKAGFAALALAIPAAAAVLAGPPGAERTAHAVPASPPGEVAILAPAGLIAPDSSAGPQRKREPAIPSRGGLRAAWAFATERGGLVSFAVVDSRGRLRARHPSRLYSAASVVKVLVLAAELRRLADAGDDVDSTTDSLLTAMITASDNEAADAIYARVGDPGLPAVAKRAGMSRFRIYGHWGNAQITAADMARFFADLDRVLPREHREYGQSLLGSVIASQSWGIPEAAGDRWAVRFKGGWLPDHALVHQAAELRERGGPREISIAILTDEQPSHSYGVETVRGVAERLLERR